jgi:eukaryotic-like serine/threonine-protein kinase
MDDRALTTKKLGRYDITRVLGKGAMGVVYEARDPNLNRKVAIKTVRVDSLSKDDAADYELRFRTEAHSAARLQHPNIVSVYDSDRDGSTPFLVMEFVQGEDLKHYLDIGQRYTLEQSVRMMRDLLAALEYAHQHKIIHRDIKPANLLIEANGRVKLTDFGVARIQDSGEVTRTQGGMVGTLKYMSPEQVEGKAVGAESDLFSAGIVLYQLLTDRRPFDGDSYFSIVNQITNQNPPSPSSINQMLPTALDAVVARALAKDKTQRFASAQDFSVALQAAARRADPTITPSANPYKTIDPNGTNSLERSGSTASKTLSNTGSTVTQELELVYWKDVKESDDPQDLEGFIKRFPDGVYADLAKRRLRRMLEGTASKSQGLYENTAIAPRPVPEAMAIPAPAMASTPESVAAPAQTILPPSDFLLDDDPTFPGSIMSKSAAANEPPAFLPIPDNVNLSPEPTFPLNFTKADLLKSQELPLAPEEEATVLIAPSAKKSADMKSLESMSFKDALQGNLPKTAKAAPADTATATAASTVPEAPAQATEAAAPVAAPALDSAPAPRRKTGLLVGAAAAVLAVVAAWAWLGGSSKTDTPNATAAAPAVSASASLPSAAPRATDAPDPAATSNSSSVPVAATLSPKEETISAALPAPAKAVSDVTASPAPSAALPIVAKAAQNPVAPASAALSAEDAAKAKAAKAAVSAAKASARAQAQRDAASGRSSAISGTYTTSTPSLSTQAPSTSHSANDPGHSQQNTSAPSTPKPMPVERPKETAPSSPNEACKDRVLLGFTSCITEQCGKSAFAKHPVCIERREQEERRKAAEQFR